MPVATTVSRLTSKSVPSGAHLQWLAAVEYRYLAEQWPASQEARAALGSATWQRLELRLLLEALFGQELRTIPPGSAADQALRDAIAEIQTYHAHLVASVTVGGGAAAMHTAGMPSVSVSDRYHTELSTDTLRKVAEAMRRHPWLGTWLPGKPVVRRAER